MERDEAIEWIKQLKAIAVPNAAVTQKLKNKAIDMAIEALENQPRWIPVEERLPENMYEDVFVIPKWDDEIMVAYTSDSCDGLEWVNSNGNIVSVEAWMPIPEYKESEVEK